MAKASQHDSVFNVPETAKDNPSGAIKTRYPFTLLL